MSEDYTKRLQSDSAQFRALLPDMLWLEVIRKLLDENDDLQRSVNFQTLINSSPYFRELKRADRTVMLWPQVLQIINNMAARRRRTNNDQ